MEWSYGYREWPRHFSYHALVELYTSIIIYSASTPRSFLSFPINVTRQHKMAPQSNITLSLVITPVTTQPTLPYSIGAEGADGHLYLRSDSCKL